MSVLALRKARGFDQSAVHLIKQTIITPSVKVAADGRNWRKVVGQHAPLIASCRDIQDRVEHIAQIRRSWAARSPEPLDQEFNQRPFRVGQILCASVALSAMLAAGELGPGHGGLR